MGGLQCNLSGPKPTSGCSGISPFLPADLYSHAGALNPILFNFPRPADSNAASPNAVWRLVPGLFILLYISSQGKYFQIVCYRVLQVCGHLDTYRIQFRSPSWLQWDPFRHWWISARWGICLSLCADLYSHAEASNPTRFDSSRPANSNPPRPDAVRPLVDELSIPLYISSPCYYCQIVSYWVPHTHIILTSFNKYIPIVVSECKWLK